MNDQIMALRQKCVEISDKLVTEPDRVKRCQLRVQRCQLRTRLANLRLKQAQENPLDKLAAISGKSRQECAAVLGVPA